MNAGQPGNAIEIRDLVKSYRVGHIFQGRRPALRGLSLTVARGEVFGYLGPNGSGKTTTLKVLLGLIFPDSGTATILGSPISEPDWRYRVGYQPEHPYFYDYLTAPEYLEYAGQIFALPRELRRERSQRLLERLGLMGARTLPLRRFSKGMVQRLGLAQALINDPELVLLDEPMSGLDPLGRRLVRDLILELKDAGKTIFFSTHILSDAETLCDRVALIRGGTLLKSGSLSEILNVDVAHLEVLVSGAAGALSDPPAGIHVRHAMGERVSLEVPEEALVAALEWVQSRKARVLAVQPIRQSLEDYFMKEMAPGEGGAWPLPD